MDQLPVWAQLIGALGAGVTATVAVVAAGVARSTVGWAARHHRGSSSSPTLKTDLLHRVVGSGRATGTLAEEADFERRRRRSLA